MTNKEAIEILKQFKKCLSDVVFDEKGSEAWQMAIKALSQELKILDTIDFAIDASNGDTNYFVGFRNGLRYAKSLIDGEEPQYESCAEQEPCDDAVSRQAVINAIENDCMKGGLGSCFASYDDAQKFRGEIEKLPPVTQKPIECEDAVSRQAVLDQTYLWSKDEFLRITNPFDYLRKRINSLPSVTQKSGWIPVSERLPEDRDWYLGIFKEMDTGWINPLPFICDYVGTKTKFTTEDFWIIRCGSDREDSSGDYYRSLRCIAWMPLPEPYKAESEVRNEVN